MKTKIGLLAACAALTLGVMNLSQAADSRELKADSFFFTGKPYVVELGAYSFQFRNYNPELQRWTTADPSGFPDGANNYGYAPIPTNSMDLYGLETRWIYGTAVLNTNWTEKEHFQFFGNTSYSVSVNFPWGVSASVNVSPGWFWMQDSGAATKLVEGCYATEAKLPGPEWHWIPETITEVSREISPVRYIGEYSIGEDSYRGALIVTQVQWKREAEE
ncbi:MAG: hypothetical protein PHD76_10890 [Methylacidiphilales bacterium]|nr:hypothetical protein [Candidatus Methylacidiphilales bacterium]